MTMLGVLLTGVTGWLLVVLIATVVVLPYLLRGRAAVATHRSGLPVLLRLRPHYWLGFAVAPLAFVHLWPAMSEGWVRRVEPTGLYLASVAFLLACTQIGLGLRLRQPRGSRLWLRRGHFGSMLLIVALAIGHVALNSATLRMVFR